MYNLHRYGTCKEYAVTTYSRKHNPIIEFEQWSNLPEPLKAKES